jgi:hypothetical protein
MKNGKVFEQIKKVMPFRALFPSDFETQIKRDHTTSETQKKPKRNYNISTSTGKCCLF